ncbi:hypothetical protein [Hydrogenophaga sp.]|uniref:hypothetical protein n=1 Tax=Hydrogenophaga sp. TaxID=1904254 RepID=UPI0027228AD5|nr:hypothetical protein [Hydrogenophaga sp.]MDO9434416.1 hypothetical protein [Hydrogenophaga sp.]
MAQHAQIVGKVEYREGDGPLIAIRPGPVKAETGMNDVTLSWVDEEVRGSTAIPLADFNRFVKEGKIKLDA